MYSNNQMQVPNMMGMQHVPNVMGMQHAPNMMGMQHAPNVMPAGDMTYYAQGVQNGGVAIDGGVQNGGAQVTYTEQANLPPLPQQCDMQAFLQQITDQSVHNQPWQMHFDALDKVRMLLKYYPHEVNNLFAKYGTFIIEASENVKTAVQKNAFMFLREVFTQAAQHAPMDQVVEKFVPLLMVKSQCEKTLIKEEAKLALNHFVNTMCARDCSYTVACQLASHKNMGVAEKSAVCLAKLIQNGGAVSFTKLQPATLQTVMQTLVQLLAAKNQRVVNYAEQIVNHIATIVGQENFYSLMHHVLSPTEQEQMGRCITESYLRSEKKSKGKETFLTHRKAIVQGARAHAQNAMAAQNLMHQFNNAVQGSLFPGDGAPDMAMQWPQQQQQQQMAPFGGVQQFGMQPQPLAQQQVQQMPAQDMFMHQQQQQQQAQAPQQQPQYGAYPNNFMPNNGMQNFAMPQAGGANFYAPQQNFGAQNVPMNNGMPYFGGNGGIGQSTM